MIGVERSSANQDIFAFSRRSSCLKTKSLEKAVLANLDLNWYFSEIPPLPSKVKTDLSSVIESLSEEDERWWSDDEVDRHLKMMSPVNLNYLKELQVASPCSYCAMYRRVRQGKQRAELRKDGLAGFLRTARGGSSRQMLVRVE